MAKDTLIFGLHAVQAALERRAEQIEELLVLDGRRDQRLQAVLSRAEQAGIRVRALRREALDKLAPGNHQGVVARLSAQGGDKSAAILDEGELHALLDNLDGPPFLLVLDGVTDPHNLGACLRSADAAGVHAVITPKDNAASLTPVARKVACGAAENVPLVQVTNLARCLRELQERGIWIVGAAGETDQSLYQSDLRGPLAIAMGAEGSGLRRLTKECCDFLVKIPMAGSVSSLNVSVATGICLFEAVRQRGT